MIDDFKRRLPTFLVKREFQVPFEICLFFTFRYYSPWARKSFNILNPGGLHERTSFWVYFHDYSAFCRNARVR